MIDNTVFQGRIVDEPDELLEKPKKSKSFLDVFLFPLNKMGLAHIFLFTFFILLLKLVQLFLFHLLGPIAVYLLLALRLVSVLIGAELFLYLIQCVQDSADGVRRAPDSLLSASSGFTSLGDIIGQYLMGIAPYIFCFLPAILYLAFTEKTDWIFFTLLTAGGFYFPILFLAVVLFDSSAGFNPFVHIASIVSTFFSYCILVGQCLLLVFLFYVCGLLLGSSRVSGVMALPITLYFLMVLMHLLGRFYYHNEEKLRWDV